MTPTRRVVAAPAVVAVVAVAAVALGAWAWWHRTGVVVVVRNDESHVVRSVEVSTTAGVYALGDLAPGTEARTVVGARGESIVRVAWTDPGDKRTLTDVGPYFEAAPDGSTGYSGEVHVSFRDRDAVAHDNIHLCLSPFSRGKAPTPDRTSEERYPR